MFRLKEMRLAAGLKRSELAKNLRINQNTLANYENETRGSLCDSYSSG